MKKCIKHLFLLPALIAGLNSIMAIRAPAQIFTTLHSFNGFDGAYPAASLILSGNTLYGATFQGGGYNLDGTVFALNTNGTGFTTLYLTFGTDGAYPYGGLILSGNTLYGTASQGGADGVGTVFAININGTSFTTLHSFNGQDGEDPVASLILSGNTLYGTAYDGDGYGTVFSLSLPLPQLTIAQSGTNVVLTWPTNPSGFTLQFTTNLVSPAVWNTNLPPPVVMNGQNAVTNPISGPQMFFRLQ